MNKDDLKIGSNVYAYERWSNSILRAEVIKIYDDSCELRFMNIVDRYGNDRGDMFGVSRRVFDQVWHTAKEAWAAIDKEHDNAVIRYSQNMETVEDLLKFPLLHCLCGEEYTDYAAIDAYKKRCSELLDINLSD